MKKVPAHIVLYPDGNRRWARKKGLITLQGHQHGYINLIKFCQWCRKKKIKIITVFGFSTENWNRPKREVQYLIKLFENYLEENIKKFQKNGMRIKIIGQKNRLPESLQKIIKKTENLTKDNKEYSLNLAISYGGRWDILQAVKKIIKKNIPLEKISEKTIGDFISTAGLPDPDLVIRAGGEKRLSNFLLWQGAYSEFYFSKKLWPEFSENDLDKALSEFVERQRRFGH